MGLFTVWFCDFHKPAYFPGNLGYYGGDDTLFGKVSFKSYMKLPFSLEQWLLDIFWIIDGLTP